MRTMIALMAVLAAAPALAQTGAPQQPAREFTGSVTTGAQQIDNSSNSAKLTEYRDLSDNFYLPRLMLFGRNRQNGWFFSFTGADVSRDDQRLLLDAGQPGRWRVNAHWTEVPHNFSTKAVTPYVRRAPGLLDVPATIPITFKKLATSSAADATAVVASDDLIAAYQKTFLAPTPLATQNNAGRLSAEWIGSDALSLGIAWDRRSRFGSKRGYGPIGDRPPRTLNIELAEPVDHRTNDVTLSAEHTGGAYQVRGEYLFSDFANDIDTLQWQNVYTTAAPGATYDVWDRAVSVYGVRPLAPDNRYHNLTGSLGLDLPFESRLMASAAYGRLEQNETLLPYSYHVDALAVRDLPRGTADARMNTTSLTADYVVAPVARLQLRGFYRYYDLDNQTPSSRWQYITNDTSNVNGTSSYVNKRVNMPYAWDRRNGGVEATLRMPARSNLTLGFERERVARDHREADTSENIFRAALRTRVFRWTSIDARYLHGVRDGSEYHNQVTQEGYWYSPSDATDNNNPRLTFDNHPDMRRYDVSDRDRRQADVRVSLTPGNTFSLGASVRYRKDDFDSDVRPSQPLLGTGLADAAARSPGNQLGWLENSRLRYGLDAFVQLHPRLSFNAFVNRDSGNSIITSLEFNENNKANPTAIASAELGPWTRGSSEWSTDTDDKTWSVGVGTAIQLHPDRVTLAADYRVSLADVEIAYTGFGVTNWDGTPFAPNHQFAFSTAPPIREDWRVLNVRVEFAIQSATLIAGYSFEDYRLDDWQQGGIGTWVEAVRAETLLRDTSRSFQWGNRLFNMGTYLSPGYNAHIGFLGLRYRF